MLRERIYVFMFSKIAGEVTYARLSKAEKIRRAEMWRDGIEVEAIIVNSTYPRK